MNNLDGQYQSLLQYIINHGTEKKDRTGTGTISVFGRQIRHKMSEGFPLLTTKKMAFKTMATELIWFLRGDTNIKFLLDNNCHIWDGDAYKNWFEKGRTKFEKFADPMLMSEDALGEEKFHKISKEWFIEKIKTDADFAEKWGDLGPVYGKQWRRWTKKKMYLSTDGSYENIYDEADQTVIDQISCLINELKTNPDSRRLMVSAWNVGELDSMVLPPCHYGFQVYTRELSAQERLEWVKVNLPNIDVNGFVNNDEYSHKWVETLSDNIPTRAISLMWNQRSVDTFLGLPFNIASYGLLLEIIAKAVNMIPDELIGNLGDCHLYLSDHIEAAKEQISREPYGLPKLNINTEFWPTESGECGIGPIDALTVFNNFKDDNFCKCLLEEDIQLSNYQSHPTIKASLSN